MSLVGTQAAQISDGLIRSPGRAHFKAQRSSVEAVVEALG